MFNQMHTNKPIIVNCQHCLLLQQQIQRLRYLRYSSSRSQFQNCLALCINDNHIDYCIDNINHIGYWIDMIIKMTGFERVLEMIIDTNPIPLEAFEYLLHHSHYVNPYLTWKFIIKSEKMLQIIQMLFLSNDYLLRGALLKKFIQESKIIVLRIVRTNEEPYVRVQILKKILEVEKSSSIIDDNLIMYCNNPIVLRLLLSKYMITSNTFMYTTELDSKNSLDKLESDLMKKTEQCVLRWISHMFKLPAYSKKRKLTNKNGKHIIKTKTLSWYDDDDDDEETNFVIPIHKVIEKERILYSCSDISEKWSQSKQLVKCYEFIYIFVRDYINVLIDWFRSNRFENIITDIITNICYPINETIQDYYVFDDKVKKHITIYQKLIHNLVLETYQQRTKDGAPSKKIWSD